MYSLYINLFCCCLSSQINLHITVDKLTRKDEIENSFFLLLHVSY